MKLFFYAIEPDVQAPRPAAPTRQWMDDSSQAFAYRCLPLNIANAHGWELLCPAAFSARWNGSHNIGDIDIRCAADAALQPASIFGHGILTFHLHGIFRTEPGWNLFAGGPPNRPKDGIYPLSGVIETDWAPYTFTMNWQFTRPHNWVSFDEGEPFCFVFPVQRGLLDQITPELRSIADDPKLQADFENWSRERSRFTDNLMIPGSQEEKERWQKRYYRGIDMQGRAGIRDHQAKLRLAEFADKRSRKSAAPVRSHSSGLPVFFRKVVKLSRIQHANLGLNEDDYGFAATTYLIPLAASELIAASQDYPVVFSVNNPPRPLCVVGTRPGINLFVDADGRWRSGCYIPAAARRFPFITIVNHNDPNAWDIGIDETASRLDPSAPKKLFANGEITAICREQLEFCAWVAAAFEETDKLAGTLPHETLLMPCRNVAPARLAARGGMAGLRVIDPERLAGLPDATRSAWQASGWLAALEAQIGSARNWGRLLALEEASLAPTS